jgi:hypothetical protein
VWAKRLVPVTTAKKNAVKLWASGIALGEVGVGNGSVCATRRPNPICRRYAMELPSPPNGVTAFGVSASTIFAPTNSGVIPARAALGASSDGSIFIQPLCPTSLHHVDLGFNFGVRVKWEMSTGRAKPGKMEIRKSLMRWDQGTKVQWKKETHRIPRVR